MNVRSDRFSSEFQWGVGAVAAALLVGSGLASAQSSTAAARVFGKDLPVTVDALPPGILRSQMDGLPPAARERALGWLRRFEFPEADVVYLRADPRGGVFYEDPAVRDAAGDGDVVSESLPSEITGVEVFTLHSKPGATRTVYLDMDGHVVTGTAWNGPNANPLYMRPYDTDGDETSFSQAEIDDIAEVWKRVAEDYAPYDIDVTTEEPAAFGPQVGHILVTRKADEYNNEIYNCSCGGVAYVGVWGQSNYTYYQPALVFLDGVGGPHNVAEAASHELGHNLSLSHDGTGTVGYYSGHGAGYTDWGPIMGVGYYAQVTQWSEGEYADANNPQDDLAIIGGHLSYRGDDHADVDFGSATPLVRVGATTIAATNPVTDPDNLNPDNKGIIEDRSDVDLFYVDAGSGIIDLTVTPAWIADFSAASRRGMNLDVRATLYDQSGVEVASSNPVDDTYAAIYTTVAAGRYVLAVEGVGVRTPTDGYSDYASIGQYFINGSIPEEIVHTGPPAAPNDLHAELNGENSVALTWTDPDSTPETNEAGYRLYRAVDGAEFALVATLARDSDVYDDNNLQNGGYTYRVDAFNGAGSESSNVAGPVQIARPLFAYASAETTLSGSILSGSYLDTASDAGFERLTEQHQGGRPSKRVSALEHVWTVSGVAPGAAVTLAVDTEAPANQESDDFLFSYAVNGGAFIEFGTLMNGTGRQVLSETLPPGTAGTVEIRVVDSNRSVGNGAADTLDVHSIVISSAGDPGDRVPMVTIDAPSDGASVTGGEPVVLAATAEDFEDGDISFNVTWFADDTTHLGTGAAVTVDSLSIGTHAITASVVDSAGNGAEAGVSLIVTDPNGPSTVSVSSLTGESSVSRNKWTAEVTAVVRDNKGAPVPSATVTGTWSSGGTGSCTTDGSGACTLLKGGLKSNLSSVVFTVTDVAHSYLTYSSGTRSVIIQSP